MDKLIAKTVEIALNEGVIEVKNKIIQDSRYCKCLWKKWYYNPRGYCALFSKYKTNN